MLTNVDLRGFRELDKALGDLVQQTNSARGRAVLRKTGRDALEPMAARAASLAPDRTGLLAFSIGISERGTRRAAWRQASARFVAPGVFEGIRKNSITLAMGPSGPFHGQLYYAAHVEFGTVDTPAHPYMRPAWDALKEQSLDTVKTSLWAEIQRVTSLLAVRRQRIGA